jgi:hypothetical protein
MRYTVAVDIVLFGMNFVAAVGIDPSVFREWVLDIRHPALLETK